jgi:hypothetical protein
MNPITQSFFKRELFTILILVVGWLLMKWAPDIAQLTQSPDASPVLFKLGMGAMVVSVWRWVLRLLMPWFRAHRAFEEAVLRGNVAASIALLSYVLLLMASWWLASIQ